jgi:hypothetical protein
LFKRCRHSGAVMPVHYKSATALLARRHGTVL